MSAVATAGWLFAGSARLDVVGAESRSARSSTAAAHNRFPITTRALRAPDEECIREIEGSFGPPHLSEVLEPLDDRVHWSRRWRQVASRRGSFVTIPIRLRGERSVERRAWLRQRLGFGNAARRAREPIWFAMEWSTNAPRNTSRTTSNPDTGHVHSSQRRSDRPALSGRGLK